MSKQENVKPVETDNEEELQTARQEIFSYYRRLRSNLFSDTIIEYETKLTKEVFDLKLQQLSQDKKQSEFENFILVAASRLITPNIKPQTGPDGGGDGKVDGETYPVDKAISDNGGFQMAVLVTSVGQLQSVYKKLAIQGRRRHKEGSRNGKRLYKTAVFHQPKDKVKYSSIQGG